MRAAWLLLLVSGTAGAQTHAQGLARAERELSLGRWRLAEQEYRRLLLNRPKSPIARVGLGRALAMLWECDEALELLASARHAPAWNVEAALAQGRCDQIQGRPLDALEAYQVAVRRDPDSAEGWLAIAQTAGALGDRVGLERALDALRLTDGAELEWLVRAEVALREGDPGFDGWLAQARSALGPAPQLDLLDARAWLDAGDPAQAEATLVAALAKAPGNAQLAVWRVEALRRLGRADEAVELLGRPDLEDALREPTATAIRARVLVDRGHLDEADAIVQSLSDPLAAEALASGWYLARARGRDTTRIALLWRSVDGAAGRELSQLVPIPSGGRP